MAGLTATGLVIKTLPEIINDIDGKLKARYGSAFSTNTNTPEGILIGIFADAIDEVWQGVQSCYDASYPRTAFGTSLDNVSDLVAVTRVGSAKSRVDVEFTGTVGTVVPNNTAVVVSQTNEKFTTLAELTLVNSSFSDLNLSVGVVANNTDYTVIINDVYCTYTSGVSATATSIISGLLDVVNTSMPLVTATSPTPTTLRINVTEVNSVLTLIVGAGLNINTISNIVSTEAMSSGQVRASTGTITTTLVPVVGITSLVNLGDATLGRDKETDEELRIRRFESVNIVGASTFGALSSRIRNLDAVFSAFIIENDTSFPDAEGRPSKSFETVVEGGNLDDIAGAIWKYKPVGIETFGDITRTINDEDGVPRTVNFSRPVNTYIHVQVDYKRYTEEPFPTTAVQGIKDAVVSYGNTLNIGTDIIPERFYGEIYRSVSGLGKITVRMAKSYDGINLVTPYTEDTLIINRKELPLFSLENISVSEV